MLASPGHEPITAHKPDPDPGGPAGTVHGPAVDVILWAFGRHGPIEVQIDGDADAVAALPRPRARRLIAAAVRGARPERRDEPDA